MSKVIEYGDVEYVLLSDPQPTGRMAEWSAQAETIDGHPVVLYWIESSASNRIDIRGPAHVEYL